MTTEERLENLERELARAKRRNRWLVAVMALVLMGLVYALASNSTRIANTRQDVGDLESKVADLESTVDDLQLKELERSH
jgi:cell division protein FtsL